VNGTPFARTVSEAVALSPAIQEQLSVDICSRTFSISNSEITSATFPSFQKLFQGDESVLTELKLKLKFASILSRAFLNPALERFFSARLDFSQFSIEVFDDLLSSDAFSIESADILLRMILSLRDEYFRLLRHLTICV
jgi:hypothetical protein